MTKKITKKDYVLLFRGGANPADMTPEQMKTTMNNWMTWMNELKKRHQFTLGHPLEDGGKVLSGAQGKNVTAFKDDKDAVAVDVERVSAPVEKKAAQPETVAAK